MIHFSWSREGDNRFAVTIKTPVVRVGTLHRLTAAIYALGFDVISGDIRTLEEDGTLYSCDEFLLAYEEPEPTANGANDRDGDRAAEERARARGGGPAQLGAFMESLLRDELAPDFLLTQRNLKPPERWLFFEAQPEILFSDDEREGVTQFYIEVLSRRGLLYYLTRVLSSENVDIVRARIRTSESGLTEDTFYLRHNGGCLGPELSARIERRIRE